MLFLMYLPISFYQILLLCLLRQISFYYVDIPDDRVLTEEILNLLSPKSLVRRYLPISIRCDGRFYVQRHMLQLHFDRK